MAAAAPPLPPATLKDQLASKQKDLAQAETDLGTYQSKAQGLRVEVQTLTAAVTEHEKNVSNVTALIAANKGNSDSLADLKKKLDAAVKAKKDQIDKEIVAQEGLVTEKQKAADAAAALAKTAQDNYDQTISDGKAAENDAAAIKSQIQDASKAISDVTALLKQADALYKSGNAAGAYFLLNEAAAIKIDVPTAEKVTAGLNDAQNRALAAKAKAAIVQPQLAKSKSDSDAAAQAYATSKSGRRAAIVTALKPFN